MGSVPVRKPGRLVVAGSVLLALVVGVEGQGGTKDRPLAADRLEAALAAPVLAEEQIELRGQIAQLQKQVDELTVQLAEAQLRADQLEVVRAKMTGPGGSLDEPAGLRDVVVVEVSRDLALVVLEGGRLDGLKAGLMMAVLRGDKAIAKVRVVDVREKISGARIVKVLGDGYPQPGDRSVIWRSTTE